jgi:hypothetical protein
VDNAVRVEIVERVHQLLGYLANFVFWKIPVVFEDLEQLTLSELGNHAKLMRGLERVQKQDDVLVVEALQNVDFLPEIVQLFLRFATEKES